MYAFMHTSFFIYWYLDIVVEEIEAQDPPWCCLDVAELGLSRFCLPNLSRPPLP